MCQITIFAVQFSRSVVANSLQPHGLQHSRLPFFIHPSADRHLGCFDVLAIVNSTAMNIKVLFFFSFFCFGFFRIYAQKWYCWVIWQFYSQFFKETPYCFPQWLYQFTFPPAVQEGSHFLHTLSSTGCLWIFLLWPFCLVWCNISLWI